MTLTTVHGQGTAPVQAGARISLRVDPSDPSYAELSGDRLVPTGAWIVFALCAFALTLITMWLTFLVLRRFAHRLPSRHAPDAWGH